MGRSSAGEIVALVTWPISRSPDRTGAPTGAGERPSIDQAHELSRDAAVAAMQHADDDFLADVAPFRQADGASLDPRFERDRVFVHIAMKDRDSRFDPNGVGRGRIDRHRTGAAAASSSARPPARAPRRRRTPARRYRSRASTITGWPSTDALTLPCSLERRQQRRPERRSPRPPPRSPRLGRSPQTGRMCSVTSPSWTSSEKMN